MMMMMLNISSVRDVGIGQDNGLCNIHRDSAFNFLKMWEGSMHVNYLGILTKNSFLFKAILLHNSPPQFLESGYCPASIAVG